MNRSFDRLGDETFDLLVVGGGIYGAWTAYDAALRGLKVALVEQGDWAGATSSASSKLIHGGLRYLENLELGLVGTTLAERKRLARLGPHRVRPLDFLLPVYHGDRVGPLKLRLGLTLYDILAGAGQPVRRHEKLSAEETARGRHLRPEGLRGGFLFGDCQTDDARLVLEIVDGACEAGVVTANRAVVREWVVRGARVRGAVVQDLETGRRVRVRSEAVVACAGPWVGELVGTAAPRFRKKTRLTKGVHLVLPRQPVREALLIPVNHDGRIVFMIPWYGRTLVGTTDTDYDGDPADVRVEDEDVAYLLEAVNRVFGPGHFRPRDVIAGFAGLRTLPASRKKRPSAVSREWRLHEPVKGLIAMVGGKLTSARVDAGVTVDRVLKTLGRKSVPCATADRRFPWAPPADDETWSPRMLAAGLSLGLDEETAEWCQLRYGNKIERLYDLICEGPELARRVVPDAPFCLAEIVHSVRHEMAMTLEDVLRRRVPLLLTTRLSEGQLGLVMELVAQTLEWSEARCREEFASASRPDMAHAGAHDRA